MSNMPVRITDIQHATHDVLNIVTRKPEDIEFTPGQATEIAVDKAGWREEGRPFTFVCLPQDDYLEFMIKTYPSHHGVTNQLLDLTDGDELLLGDVFGAINYAGEGTFIAGGAGVTPFISILRDLRNEDALGENKLIFANRSKKDIILRDEFQAMLGSNFINILEEQSDRHAHGRITADFLKQSAVDFDKHIYLCGPKPMMADVKKQLLESGATEDKIIQEEL